MAFKNPATEFLETAVRHSDRLAVIGDDYTLSYGQLHDLVVALALNLIDRGVRQRGLVAVRSDDPIVVYGTLFATALVGSSWTYASRRLLDASALGPNLVLFDEDETAETAGYADAVALDDSWLRPPAWFSAGTFAGFPGFRHGEDTWLIKPTSGTTGTPKLVPVSVDVAAARFAAASDMVSWPGMGVVGLFPASASALLTRYPAVLLQGGTIVHSATPRLWVDAGVGLVVGSPIQIRTVLQDVKLPRRIARIHASGGTLADAVVHDLARSFEQVANGYGSTETNNCLSNIKTILPDGQIVNQTKLRGEVSVEIVDDADQPLPVGKEGIVRVKTPYLATSYINSPDASAKAFRDGWFYPGDLGLWTTRGEFMVTGRINDQFNIGGMKINALLLDATLQSVEGIRDAMTFLMPRATGVRLTALLTVDPSAAVPDVLANARIALIRAVGREFVPERFLFADKLPRNANGKPDRKACVTMVSAVKAARES